MGLQMLRIWESSINLKLWDPSTIEKYGKYGWAFAKINPRENKGEIIIDVSELEGIYKNHLFTTQYLPSTCHLSPHLELKLYYCGKQWKIAPTFDRGSAVNVLNEWMSV